MSNENAYSQTGIFHTKSKTSFSFPFSVVVVALALFAGTTGVEAKSIDATDHLGTVTQLKGWSGLKEAPGMGPGGGDAARLDMPGEASFRYPEEDGWQEKQGFDPKRNPAGGWKQWPILALDVKPTGNGGPIELSVELIADEERKHEPVTLQVSGDGWRTLHIPLESFRLNDQVAEFYLLDARGLRIQAERPGGNAGGLLLKGVRLKRGRRVGLVAPVQSKSGEPGETLNYEVTLVNSTDQQQAVSLRLDREGGEVMVTTVEPDHVRLGAGATRTVTVRAEMPTAETPGVSGALPQGARERWTLKAIPEGQVDQAASVELIHLMEMDHPYVLHTEERWDEIRKLVDTEDWAKKQARKKIERARDWQPPEPSGNGEYVYRSRVKGGVVNAMIAWQLTGEKTFARKVATFFRRFTDSERGYPAIKKACHQAMVQEGSFFQSLAQAYDGVRDAGVFNDGEITRIESVFRTYMDIATSRQLNHVGNQPLSVATGALYSALAIQDWERVERFLKGPSGIHWQIRRGIMDDGWWAEMSTNYNTWVAGMLTRSGLALRPWGVELLTDRFRAVYHESTKNYAKPGEPVEERFPGSGIYPAVWGPSHRNYRQVRDLWDATIPLINEDGRMPGMNDSPPEIDVGQAINIAAYAYGDPEYVRRSRGQRLLYPVDRTGIQKKQEDSELLPGSAADNAGVAMLRSQGVDTPREQYQAILSYGSHGGFHGHWDRLNLSYLRRFGKLLTHTPARWYGYGTLMYQMGYYQSSLAHSMVIVDGKNQYPAPSKRLMYHPGELFQAVAVENETRWSNPRFGGHEGYTEEDLEEGTIDNKWARDVPIPENPPPSGHMNDFTEPVRTRRLLAVTDEYVLVIDHVSAEKSHTYDVIFQFPNFRTFDQGNISLEEKRKRLDESPLRTGQFATSARFYKANGTVRANFLPGYDPGGYIPKPNVTEEMETLNLDVYSVWPEIRKQVVAKNPEVRTGDGEGWNTFSAARTTGREASFVTLIEVQKEKSDRQVKNVEADGQDQVKVTLTDGRTHHWQVQNLDAEEDRPSSVRLELVEMDKNGKTMQRESTE